MTDQTQAVLLNAVPLLVLAALYLSIAAVLAPAVWRERGRARGPDAATALDVISTLACPGDVVLVKASRAVGLEHVAAGLVAGSADEVLSARLGTAGDAS